MRIYRTLWLAASLAGVLAGVHASHPHTAHSAALASPPVAGTGQPAPTPDAADPARAEATLERLTSTYRHLDGVSVEFGITPNDAQAVAYYSEGRIVVSSAHTVDVETILEHEIWHVIDWRDNARMDWGEDIPPADADSYRVQ